MYTCMCTQKICINCSVRGRDYKRGDRVLSFFAHGCRKILMWKDMRFQNVDDYPNIQKRNSVCLCLYVCVSVSADSKKKTVSVFAF